MARHRNVRTMNYEDECYDDDDYLGHSVEDNYCISPGTAAQFTFNREKDFDLSTYMGNEKIPEEEEGFDSDTDPQSLNDSQGYKKPDLSDTEQGKLNSCLEEIRNILGDSTPDHVLCQIIIKNKYDLQASLNELLKSEEVPKPQRQPRQSRRNRSQGDVDDDLDSFMESLESESPEKTHFLSNQNRHLGILKFGKLSPSVESPLQNIAQKCKNDVTDSGDSSVFSSGVSDNNLRVSGSRQKGLVMPTQPKVQDKVKVNLQGQTKSLGGLSLSNLAKQHSTAGRGVSLASLAKPNVKSLQPSEKKEVRSLESLADTMKGSPQHGGNPPRKDQQPFVSTQVSGGSGTNKTAGLSLTDLINKNKMDNKSDVVTKDASHASRVSLADLAGQRSQSKVGGVTLAGTNMKVSLSDLAAKTSGAPKPGSNSGQPSSKTGKSLADLANQHKTTAGGANVIQVKSKATDAVTGQLSGLSLADLAQSHKTVSQKGPVSSGKSLRDLAPQQQKSKKTNSLSDMTNQSRSKECEKGSRISSSASGKVQSVSSVQGTNTGGVDENVLSDQFSGLMNTNIDLEYYLDNNTDFTEKVQMVSPSILAKTISSSFVCSKRLGAKKHLKFPKFSYRSQISKVKENFIKVDENIKPFDFSTPSPDDIVKKKQRLAFTRNGR